MFFVHGEKNKDLDLWDGWLGCFVPGSTLAYEGGSESSPNRKLMLILDVEFIFFAIGIYLAFTKLATF